MVASLAHAVVQLADLRDGTRLSVAMADGKLTLSADGMEPIELALPVSDLVVTDELREQLTDIGQLTYEARRTTPAAFLMCASLMAADQA